MSRRSRCFFPAAKNSRCFLYAVKLASLFSEARRVASFSSLTVSLRRSAGDSASATAVMASPSAAGCSIFSGVTSWASSTPLRSTSISCVESRRPSMLLMDDVVTVHLLRSEVRTEPQKAFGILLRQYLPAGIAGPGVFVHEAVHERALELHGRNRLSASGLAGLAGPVGRRAFGVLGPSSRHSKPSAAQQPATGRDRET